MASPAAVLSILVKAQGAQAAAAQLTELNATASKTNKAMEKTAKRAESHSKVLKGLASTAKLAGVGLGAAGLAAGLKSAVGEFRKAQKVGAQTNAVLKSTHGQAKVTKKGIEDLAGAISRKSGIDDEAIQSTENLLLTFTNIRNETGKGNKIFNQATQAVTDMSVALGQSGKSSAIQLGKALNDPIKGVTALQRVGVSFTEQQKDQIKNLVEHNKTLDAQKLILREVAKEFGGSAAAQATAGDKLKVAIGNLAEAAGGVLVPMLDKAAVFMTRLINQFTEGKGIATVIIPVFQSLGDTIKAVVDTISRLISAFKEGNAGAVILVSTIAALTAGFVAYKTITTAVAIATRTFTAAMVLLDAAMAANPIILVTAAIVALGVALVIAYQKSKTFRDIVNATWTFLKTAATTIFPVIKKMAEFGLLGPIPLIIARWKDFKTFITGAFGDIKDGMVKFANAMKDGITSAFQGAANTVIDFVNVIIDVINKIPGVPNIKKIGHVGGTGGNTTGPFGTKQAPGAAKLAKGGAFGQTGGLINRPMVMMGEQAPKFPEYVIPTNPAYRDRAQMLLGQAAGAVGMARGGLLGKLTDIPGNLLSKGASAVLGALPKASILPGWMQGLGTYVLKQVGAWIKDKVTGIFGGGGGRGGGGRVPSGNARDWLTTALNITGHFSPENLAALYGRMMQESGGNPRAINLWDSNARAGHPSKGLLQTIDSTFSSYALPGHGDIWNPIDNAIAAIRYMYGVYGHIVGPSATGYARGGVFGLPYVGAYKEGGTVPATGMGLLHKGEQVVPGLAKGGSWQHMHWGPGWYSGPDLRVSPNARPWGPARQITPGYTPLPPAPSPTPSEDAGPDPQIAELTGQISTLNDTINDLNDTISLQRQQIDAANRNYAVSQSQYAVLAKAIADVANGHIGGKVGLGFMTPGWAGGGGVRY